MFENKKKLTKKANFRKEIKEFISEAVEDFHENSKLPKSDRQVPIGVSLNIYLGTRDLTQKELAKEITLDDLDFMHEQFKGAYERVMYSSSNPNLKYLHTTLINGGEWEKVQRLILEQKKFDENVKTSDDLEFIFE